MDPLPGIPFDLNAVAATEEPATGDPVTPFVDEGDIGTLNAHELADRVTQRTNAARDWLNGKRPAKPDKPPKVEKPVPPKPPRGSLVRQLTDLYVALGTFVLPFDTVCGTAVINSAPKCAEALEALARDNPAVRRAIMRLVETSAWGMVITAHAPIMLAVAMHHIPAVRDSLPPNVHRIRPEPDGAA